MATVAAPGSKETDLARAGSPAPSETAAVLRLRGVFDQLPAAVAVILGSELRFAFANEAYQRLAGRKQLEGRTIDDAIPEAREQGFVALLEQVLATGERAVGNEVRAVLDSPDGQKEIFVDFTFQPFRGESGEVEGILVHSVDVTAAVQARQQLADALTREQENRFRQAIEGLIDTVIIAEPLRTEGEIVDFRVTFMNGGTDEVARREPSQMVGRHFTDLWPNFEASGLLRHYTEVVETGQSVMLEDFGYAEEIAGAEYTGVFDIRASSLNGDLFLAFRDVTERIQRERALAESRARLAREHEVVAQLQSAVLPRDLPTLPGARVAAEYHAASDIVDLGGDWFDAFVLRSGKVALAIGDVAGKGLSAAQVMAQVRSAGRVAALGGSDPAQVLTIQSELMITLRLGDFATAQFALYDPETSELVVASAGHLPPLIIDRPNRRYLDVAAAPPLGVSEDPAYDCTSVTLSAGARVIFFTDGLVERRGEDLSVGLAKLMDAAPAGGEAAASCRDIVEKLEVTAARADDVCVLTLDVGESH
jgi:PAS domain S-box-containing protein